ncbi:MAG: hypothetical protein PHO41_03665 [Eubacteriales bacterium]|nr:hypothetical protein [Eubacteriales bacterium]
MDRFALMERIRRGDQEAFREIFAAYRMPVYRFALEKTNDAQKARDIVKHVFSTVYESLKEEPYYGDFSAWFQTLAELKLSEMKIMEAHQLSPDAVKKKQRAKEEPVSALPVQAGETPEAALLEQPRKKTKMSAGYAIGQGLLIILRIALMGCLIWAILGMLRAMQVFALPDWGYTWFNNSVFKLF